MSARTKARKRALDILFESELQGKPLGASLDERLIENDPPVNEYSVTLVRGVQEHSAQIDELIEQHAVDWKLARMPGVDRNLLRIAVWEIVFGEVPPAVAVSQAVELARDLSTDESPGFVNGLLSAISKAVSKS